MSIIACVDAVGVAVDHSGMSDTFDPSKLRAALKTLRATMPSGKLERVSTDLTRQATTKLIQEIVKARDSLTRLADQMDPVRPPTTYMDPADPKVMGKIIADFMETIALVPMSGMQEFYGSGVYAIYYRGDFAAYRAISETDCPIYVGKADPENQAAKTPRQQGTRLSTRLREHAKTLGAAQNLHLDDFACRHLVIQSGWQKSVEDRLIERYRPVWNSETKVCAGFGKHGDTARKERSSWDILHPGRRWATKQSSRSKQTSAMVASEVERHFERLLLGDRDTWGAILNSEWAASARKA